MTYNINNYNLFVFDLDGTIINTEIYHHLAWNAVLSIYMKKNINLSYNEYCKNFHINKKNNIIVPVLGEGSLQLNLQELQTIVHHKLPIKILVFNNNTHGATKVTQEVFFNNKFGVDKESRISFPNTSKIANSYGIKYIGINKNEDLEDKLLEFINHNDTIICEIFSCIQVRYPKLSAFKNDDGTFTNRPYEDMEPFMNREELYNEMIVKPVS